MTAACACDWTAASHCLALSLCGCMGRPLYYWGVSLSLSLTVTLCVHTTDAEWHARMYMRVFTVAPSCRRPQVGVTGLAEGRRRTYVYIHVDRRGRNSLWSAAGVNLTAVNKLSLSEKLRFVSSFDV